MRRIAVYDILFAFSHSEFVMFSFDIHVLRDAYPSMYFDFIFIHRAVLRFVRLEVVSTSNIIQKSTKISNIAEMCVYNVVCTKMIFEMASAACSLFAKSPQ